MATFWMVKIHPTEDRIMVQVDNDKIELDREHQEILYKILKEKLGHD